jgi:hypothetical protein
MFIESPQHLTDISVAISEAMDALEGERFVLFDSMSVPEIHNKPNVVAKFGSYLTSKIRLWESLGVLISVNDDLEDELLNLLKQFADTIIHAPAIQNT